MLSLIKKLLGISKFLPELDLEAKLTLSIITSFSISIILFLSIIQKAGVVGGAIATFLYVLLGYAAVLVPVIAFWVGLVFMQIQKHGELANDINSRLYWGFSFILFFITGFLNILFGVQRMSQMEDGGGLVGFIFYPFLLGRFGPIAGGVILFSIGFFGFFLVSQLSFVKFTDTLKEMIKDPSKFWDLVPDVFEVWKKYSVSILNQNAEVAEDRKLKIKEKEIDSLVAENNDELREKLLAELEKREAKEKISSKQIKPIIKNSETDWSLPDFQILKENTTISEPGDIKGNKSKIKQTLADFKIEVEMEDVVTGPTVSQYTLRPASGVKLSAIDSLQRDLALALAATSVRIEAPIPGRSLVGIEIPNQIKSEVRLKEILETKQFIEYEKALPVAIGVDVAGKEIISPISKMPHLLVAGATGSGKSVWINSMLLSLLYRYTPLELEMILVDMKRVELKLYDKIPHLLAPVITSSEKAINALKWSVLEMDRRYQLLEEFGKRNIEDFNKFVQSSSIQDERLKELPYIVFVIDELGDLMMLAKNEVEPIIVRLTQMSRAVGIHLVLGTQRPDTSVVTGLIKANIPSRIAFTVASQIDSRVILDQSGAEKLLGQGDGLYLSPNSIQPIRFQGCLVEESEVRKVVKFWQEQAESKGYETNFRPEVVEAPKTKLNVPGMIVASNKDDSDEDLYSTIREYVISNQSASTSMLQTAFGIGYPKARKIITQLEEEGVVGPANGSKPRDVLIQE
jgi:S-DNA-T family DNA segregation ATPase FtsK/SpoIIIE